MVEDGSPVPACRGTTNTKFARRARLGFDFLILLGFIGGVSVIARGSAIDTKVAGVRYACFLLAALLLIRAVWSGVTIHRHRLLHVVVHLVLVSMLLVIAFYDRANRFAIALGSVPHRLTTRPLDRRVTYRFPTASTARNPHNLILITLDTLRADHLGCYGYSRDTSPHLDHLAQSGLLFENVIVQMPATVPSHAAILTGCYPWTLDVLSNKYVLPAGAMTLAERLQKEGFATGGFVSCALLRARYGFAQGFDSFFDRMSKQRRLESPAPVRVDDALEWLGELKPDTPFALWLHLFDPHAPYEAPEPFNNLFRPLLAIPPDTSLPRLNRIFRKKVPLTDSQVGAIVDSYDGEVAYMDRQLGRLFAWLAGSAFAANTLVVVTADHGEELYDHDFFIEHNRSLYQGVVRVPLLIWHAGMRRRGESSSIPIESVDLFPTLLDLLGIGHDEEDVDGNSFIAVLEAEEATWDREAQVTRRTLARAHSPAQAVLASGYKYIHFSDPSREDELYNLLEDASEQINLLAEEPGRAEGLREVLRQRFDVEFSARESLLPEISEEREQVLRALGYLE